MSSTIEAQIYPVFENQEPGAPAVIQAEFVDRRQAAPGPGQPGFVDRRQNSSSSAAGAERRQFGNTHYGLSPAARELAEAIDSYKLQHRRRYVT
ncbi:MAG: hypothetical protein ACTHK7_22305 [Aureliella sp.]